MRAGEWSWSTTWPPETAATRPPSTEYVVRERIASSSPGMKSWTTSSLS